jgi:hypothetical protein
MLRGRSARGRLGMAPGRLGMAPGRLGMAPGRLGMAQGRQQPAGGQGGAEVRPMPSVRMLVPVDGSIVRTRNSQVSSLRLDAL